MVLKPEKLEDMRMPTDDSQCDLTFFRHDLGRGDGCHLLELGLIFYYYYLVSATILLIAWQ